MSLRIQDITLANFRSYQYFALNNLEELNILFGPNAIGKTNVIEALQLLTALTSFRKATSSEMTKQGSSDFLLSANMSDGNRQLEVELVFDGEKRTYRLNGKTRTIKDLKGMIPAILFAPEDLDLVKRSDSLRRGEIDLIGQQVNANYYQITRDFEKLLRHRNRLLKDEAPDDLLDALSELFTKVGSQLTAYRRALIERMTPFFIEAYKDISGGEELAVNYIPSSEDQEDFQKKQEEARIEERARHQTIIGPHRDKIQFLINGMDVGSFASQGQQRSVVLSLKMAEVRLIEEILQQKPVLLLDDVMSELDAQRRQAMVEYLLPETQTFITTANLEYLDIRMREKALIIDIQKHLTSR